VIRVLVSASLGSTSRPRAAAARRRTYTGPGLGKLSIATTTHVNLHFSGDGLMTLGAGPLLLGRMALASWLWHSSPAGPIHGLTSLLCIGLALPLVLLRHLA